VIDWVMKTQNVGFREAVEILAPSISTTAVRVPSSLAAPVANTTPITENADDQKALQQVISYYHQTLKQSPEALAYLDKRGLNDPELINHFKLGYANRGATSTPKKPQSR